MVYRFTPGTTGIDEGSSSFFTLFPNPGNGELHIRLKDPVTNADFSVYDLTGQRVYHSQGNFGKLSTVNLLLASGLYVAELRSGESVYRKNIVIQ
jgi:hypothetical protein